jgi:hypothetical protein
VAPIGRTSLLGCGVDDGIELPERQTDHGRFVKGLSLPVQVVELGAQLVA